MSKQYDIPKKVMTSTIATGYGKADPPSEAFKDELNIHIL